MAICSVFGCKTRSGKGAGISLHRFPNREKSPKRFSKWAEYCKRKKFYPREDSRICSKHFKSTDYVESQILKRRLMPNEKFRTPKLKPGSVPCKLMNEFTDSQLSRKLRYDKKQRKALIADIFASIPAHENPGCNISFVKVEAKDPDEKLESDDQCELGSEVLHKYWTSHSNHYINNTVKQEDSGSKFLHIHIKSEMTDMKNESMDDDGKVENFLTEEFIIKKEADSTSSTFHQNKMEEESSRSNLDEKLVLDVVKQDSYSKSLQLEAKSEILDIKYEIMDDSDEVSIKMENMVHEELIIKDEVTKTIPDIQTRLVEKRFKCKECHKSYQWNTELQRHIMTHTGENRFSCNLCDYKSVYKSSVQRHMMRHTGEKPISCNLCDYKCIEKGRLHKHMRIHTGEKPFNCDKCNYKTANKCNLQLHMSIHTEEKPFICTICDYKSANKSSLRRHRMIHTEEKPCHCNECDYKCRRKFDLMKHMRRHMI